MFSEKLKELRKQTKMSQEQLAEKLNVSRQAVTKWETNVGTPDINNLIAISKLFDISLDHLLNNNKNKKDEKEYLFNSVTEYDIDGLKNYDIVFSSARQLTLKGYDGEKIHLILQSNKIVNIQEMFKTKIDDVKNKIDIDINFNKNMTQAKAKEDLDICVLFPLEYINRIEIAGNIQSLIIRNIIGENLEFSGKTSSVTIDGMPQHIELNSNEDLEILCKNLDGRLDINQLSATSKLTIPKDTVFASKIRGIGNHIFYQQDSKETTDFSLARDSSEVIGSIIELNGMKSELIINSVSDMHRRDV